MREFARQRKSLARGNLWKTKAARDLTGISKPASGRPESASRTTGRKRLISGRTFVGGAAHGFSGPSSGKLCRRAGTSGRPGFEVVENIREQRRDPRYLEPPAIIQDRFLLLRTMTLSNLPALFSLAAALELPTVSELRWQLAGFAVGIVILSFGLAGLALFFFERKTADRSLVYFSLFAFLYALRFIFRQSFLHSLVAAPEVFWK